MLDIMMYVKFRKYFTITIALIVITTSFFPSIKSSSVNESQTNNVEFDLKIKVYMKLLRFPSLIVCIIKNDSIVFMKPYGFTDYYLRKKATNDSIYLTGSISKSVTATALMQLYDQGLFGLDEDVSKYLPFKLRNPKYPNVNITFRMLLSHQTSLSDFGIRIRKIPYILVSSHGNNSFYPLLEEMLVPGGKCYNKRYWSKHPPGSIMQYSELGPIIAAYLVEKFSGLSFEDYCQEHIFQPLNMTNTSFDPCKLNQTRLTKPYALFGRRFMPFPKYDFCFLDPPAGMWTKAEDLSHFFIAHMNGGVYKGKRILEEDTVKQMHTKQYPNYTDNLLGLLFRGRVTVQHGLGWQIADLFGINIEGHTGGAPGYNCHMYIVEHKTNETAGIILLSNGPFFSPVLFSYMSTIVGYQKLIGLIIEKIDVL